MRTVMGEMNGVRLRELMTGAEGRCSRVTAAVAYATQNNPFFESCINNKIFLEFFDRSLIIQIINQRNYGKPCPINCWSAAQTFGVDGDGWIGSALAFIFSRNHNFDVQFFRCCFHLCTPGLKTKLSNPTPNHIQRRIHR